LLSLAAIEEDFADRMETTETVFWDDDGGVVRALKQRCLGALVMRREPLQNPAPDAVTRTLLGAIRERGLDALPWGEAARALRQRLLFLNHIKAEGSWPDVSPATLTATLEEWLEPWLAGLTRWSEMARLDFHAILLAKLPGRERSSLDRLAPAAVTVPSGRTHPIDYSESEAPVLKVRIQEMFGLGQTPSIADGRVNLKLHLLAPSGRVLAVTSDLRGFWQSAYREVRAEMRGRYPKHPWPEDPLSALPTHRTSHRTRKNQV